VIGIFAIIFQYTKLTGSLFRVRMLLLM
jgi:hypothetical protein